MVVVYLLWYNFCSYYVAPGENFEVKAWERICRRQLLLDKIPTSIHYSFFFTPQFAPIRGTIIWGQIHSSITGVIVCKRKKSDCGWKWSRTTTQPPQWLCVHTLKRRTTLEMDYSPKSHWIMYEGRSTWASSREKGTTSTPDWGGRDGARCSAPPTTYASAIYLIRIGSFFSGNKVL